MKTSSMIEGLHLLLLREYFLFFSQITKGANSIVLNCLPGTEMNCTLPYSKDFKKDIIIIKKIMFL